MMRYTQLEIITRIINIFWEVSTNEIDIQIWPEYMFCYPPPQKQTSS
jgi:hypothetical protein